MPANWESFNQNLGGIAQALVERGRAKREQENALQMLLLKAQIERQNKQQQMQDLFDMYSKGGYFGGMPQAQPEGSIMPGTTPREDAGVSGGGFVPVPTGSPDSPFKFELSPQAQLRNKIVEARGVKRAQLTEEQNVKREVYKKDLGNFLAIDDILQEARGEGGIGRFGAGFGMSVKGFAQKGKLGQAVGAYDAVSKRLRVQLVRAAGDVGNINIVEQQAAEKLIPAKSDSKQTASIKRAYLIEIAKAIDSDDPSLVKSTLDKLGINYTEGNSKSSSDFSYLWE